MYNNVLYNSKLCTTIMKNSKISVGISSCLLGEEVRFNGGHTQSQFCKKVLSQYFDFVKFCPEVATGLSVPRSSMRLEGNIKAPKLVIRGKPETDLSTELIQASARYLDQTENQLCGYILMKKSPSCGMERIKVYSDKGHPKQTMRNGLFTEVLQEKYPALPIEEEGRLNDKPLRENFIMRVYAYHYFKQNVEYSEKYSDLLNFHSRYKYILMAHNQQEYKNLGKLLGKGAKMDFGYIKNEYLTRFMKSLKNITNRKNHINVLQHLFGYLKRHINQEIKSDILNVIEKYRRNEVNLITPLTLLKHYFKQYGSRYLNEQFYLQPYPSELGLRNHI